MIHILFAWFHVLRECSVVENGLMKNGFFIAEMELNPCFQKSFWLKPYKDQTKTVSVAKVSATNMVPREKLKGFMSWKKKELLFEM